MFKNIIIGVHLFATIFLIIVVLLQESKQNGLNSTFGGQSTDTFFGKNGGNTKEAIMRRWTAASATLFIVTSLVLSIWLKS